MPMATQTDSISNGWRDMISLSTGYCIATASFNVAPLLIGAMLLTLSLEENQAGLVLTIEWMIMAVTSFLLAPFEKFFPSRKTMLTGISIIFVTYGFTTYYQQYHTLIALKAVCGFGAGLLLLGINKRVAASNDPVRLYGIMSISATTIGALLLMVMPQIIALNGLSGAYSVLAITMLVAFPLIALAPSTQQEGSESIPEEVHNYRIPPLMAILLFIPLFIIQTAQSAYFSFTESIGAQTGLSIEEIGLRLALSYLLFGISGSALASWLGYRWGKQWPLFTGLILNALAIYTICNTENSSVYTAAVMVQTFSYFFTIPYQLGFAADLDKSGRLAAASAGVMFFGLAVGPLFGGELISHFGYLSLGITMAIGTIFSIVLFYIVRKLPPIAALKLIKEQ